ncbi:O-acyltransferase like protein-like, partial [Galendromus occidentalis]|uniref:O-acyltransferase like protein-like n=1 Tax=Galendromus occidentalis TaxID=34638 RepID=A0AAJ7SE73_9ACAR
MSAINLRFLYHFSSSKEMSRSQLRPIFLLPVVGKYGISADVLGCRDQIKERPASTGTVICGVVIGILTGLLILGTVVDIFCGNDTRGLVRVARCFSARANYLRFTNTTLTPESRRLDCLHGIRALSALWILYAHVCLKDWGNVDGILTLLWMFKSPSGVILNQFVLALETFFTLLGFSLYRLVTQERKRNNMPALKLALKVILRRAVRYIVTGMGAMAVFYVLPLITSGPGIDYMYPYLEDFCNARWWSYPIFINNLWTIQDICVENQWYTAADMQIVCILILPICLLIREPGKGIRILLYLVGGSMVYAASLTYYYGASPIFLLLPNQAIASLQLLSHLHNHSLAHLSPAAVGVLGGYLIDKYREIDLGKTVYRAGWILYSAVIIAFGMGLIRWFLSRPNFIVLSRLSLSFYLMQWPALWLSMFSTRNPYSASHYQH